jgi:aminopeptidase-like protein
MSGMDTGSVSTCVADAGQAIYDLAAEIYPICRSITGDGVRQTLAILARHIPIDIHEIPTGTRVFDWTIPREWNIREAFIMGADGRRVVDFAASNLHVMSYSVPVDARMSLEQLAPHIHTLPEQPDLIPYRTSYYAENWGFCMRHRDFARLPLGEYHAYIDADPRNGSLTYGEFYLPGQSEEEVLLSAHICHPSLANDNCSGVALLVEIAKHLAEQRRCYSYRVVFAPGTIGAIAWLARNEAHVHRIRHGLIVAGVGDAGGPTYKKSRRGDALIDRAMAHVIRQNYPRGEIVDFAPYGYDERQYCSPGFNLPVGLIQRSPFGTFPEYHTSSDNLDFIRPEHLGASFRLIADALDLIEAERTVVSRNPKCEPQLGRRGLYAAIGGGPEAPAQTMAMLWVLSLADGAHSLLDMAERAGLPFADITRAAGLLEQHGLVSCEAGEPQAMEQVDSTRVYATAETEKCLN